MTQTFKLKKGEILFDEDKIVITDDAKKHKWINTAAYGYLTFFGFLILFKFSKTGDQTYLWLGLLICLSSVWPLILSLFMTARSEISFDEVKSMKVKQRNKEYFLDIKLKNNRLRRVARIESSDELEIFIKTNIRTKMNYAT